MKNRRLLIIVSTICLLLMLPGMLCMSGCTKPAPPVAPIKIGALVPLTGPFATWGVSFGNAFEYGLDEADWEVAGRPVELIIEDEGGVDVSMALAKAKKLIHADKVDVILGPFFGGACFAVFPYTAEVPIVAVKYAMCGEEEMAFGYVLASGPRYQDGTYPIGLFAYDEMDIRTVTQIGSDYSVGHDFAMGFNDAFEARGGEVIQQQWAPLGETDYTPYLSALKMADALVMSISGAESLMAFLSQYEELGLFEKMPIIMAECGGVPPEVMQELGDTIVGVISAQVYASTLDNPENVKFRSGYSAKYNVDTDLITAISYTGMVALLAGLEATGGNADPDILAQAMLQLELDVPLGHFSFSEKGAAVCDLRITEAQKVNDIITWVPVKTYPAVQPYD